MTGSRLFLCAAIGLSATTVGCVDLVRSEPILVLKDSDVKVIVQPTAAGAAGVRPRGQAGLPTPAGQARPSRPRGTG